jgi:phosphatidylglycerol:prolipoprotein diacylglycerol transferase
MHRIIFTIAGVSVSSYSFFTVLALAVSVGGFYLFARRRGYAARDLFVILTALVPAAFFGARLLHILTNFGLYRAEPWRAWLFDYSGFSIYGGILCALLAGIIAARLMRLDIWRLGDTAAPILGIGIACMRVGCYLNGCCFGHPTDLPWGVVFPYLSQAHSHQLSVDPGRLFSVLPVHPTQIYELGYALFASFLAYVLIRTQGRSVLMKSDAKKSIPDGSAILLFGLVYTAGRWINIYLRVKPLTLDSPAWFYPALYVTMLALIIGLLIWRWKKEVLNNHI